jgi:hypothetical protein
MPYLSDEPVPPYNPTAIFDEHGPLNPNFMHEAIRTLLRALPLDPAEPQAWSDRRMLSALLAIAALHPRDEIEVMLSVQAVSAYHAAAACWRIGMNHHRPSGDSTRHIATAAAAARTFDGLLKALERRQAIPLAVPPGRPAPQEWPKQNVSQVIQNIAERCRHGETATDADAARPVSDPTVVWTPEDVAFTDDLRERRRVERENHGLDIANTEGILPDGGMIMPEDPTPQQAAYIGRRLALMYKREHEENLRKGLKGAQTIRPIRTGDLIP